MVSIKGLSKEKGLTSDLGLKLEIELFFRELCYTDLQSYIFVEAVNHKSLKLYISSKILF